MHRPVSPLGGKNGQCTKPMSWNCQQRILLRKKMKKKAVNGSPQSLALWLQKSDSHNKSKLKILSFNTSGQKKKKNLSYTILNPWAFETWSACKKPWESGLVKGNLIFWTIHLPSVWCVSKANLNTLGIYGQEFKAGYSFPLAGIKGTTLKRGGPVGFTLIFNNTDSRTYVVGLVWGFSWAPGMCPTSGSWQ